MREMDWASVITCIWNSIHSSDQSYIQHKTLVYIECKTTLCDTKTVLLINYSEFGRLPWHKYRKQSDTNGETVRVLLSLEYRTSGKGSQPIRFENQSELLYKHNISQQLGIITILIKMFLQELSYAAHQGCILFEKKNSNILQNNF